jgi:hypothetical protein
MEFCGTVCLNQNEAAVEECKMTVGLVLHTSLTSNACQWTSLKIEPPNIIIDIQNAESLSFPEVLESGDHRPSLHNQIFIHTQLLRS